MAEVRAIGPYNRTIFRVGEGHEQAENDSVENVG